jgi:hypothetical protein
MTAHFNVGDRVRIMDNKQLIEEVRGQLGYVTNVDNQDRIFVELDSGARPPIRFRSYNNIEFYSFYPRYIELLIPKTPDWEV